MAGMFCLDEFSSATEDHPTRFRRHITALQRLEDARQPGLPRSGHASALLPSTHEGEAIIFGGYTEDTNLQRAATNESWVYSNGSSTPVSYKGDICPQARLVTQATVIGNSLYILGGWDPKNKGDGGQILDDIWELDLLEYSWKRITTQGSALWPTSRHQVIAVDGKLYIHNHRTKEQILCLDTQTSPPTISSLNIDCSKDGAPSSRGLHTLTAIGSKAYVFGGAPKKGDMLGDLWKLDLERLAWCKIHATGNAPHVRCSHTATAIGGKIYFFGGSYYKQEGGLQPLNDLFLFDPATESWQWPDIDQATAPSPRNAHAAAGLSNGQLLVTGGWDPFKKSYADTFILDVAKL